YNLDQIDKTFDAVYTLNCLLHIPKKGIGHIFSLIATRLNGNGLMYLGLWGGENFEGILEQDTYEPKRFSLFGNRRHSLKLYNNHSDWNTTVG
ncbi:MAG: hypothetical protein OXI86_22385, partial [Candidatus Poribacteria bacterium]|nr:hypothetical protein [Candidatus Poribacteria bacterium]